MAQIIFDHVTKSYDDVVAIRDASFEIKKGEFVFLTGKSGAGKSTILNLMLRQEEVSSGTITVNGQNLSALSSQKISSYRRGLGYMSSDLGLLHDRTVYSNLKFAMMATGQDDRFMKKKIKRLLSQVGLLGREDAMPNELSGGEQARIMLVRALCVKPGILIADEPTANLDPDASWDLMQLLAEINYNGTTVIVASHARELVTIMKKRCIALISGNIVADEKNAIYNSRAMDVFAEREVEIRLAEEKRNAQKNAGPIEEKSNEESENGIRD